MPSFFDKDSYRCATSLRSELRMVKTLLKLAKKCLSPKLKTYAPDLEQRRLKLVVELKIRTEEENIRLDFGKSETNFGISSHFKRA
jgi:hypothetical protein